MEAKDIKRAKKQNDSEEDSADDEDDDGLAYDLSKDPDLLEDEGDVDDVDGGYISFINYLFYSVLLLTPY